MICYAANINIILCGIIAGLSVSVVPIFEKLKLKENSENYNSRIMSLSNTHRGGRGHNGSFDWLADALGFSAPSVIELIFICCAVFGGLFFFAMMALMLVGDIFGGIVDTAFDTDISMDSTTAFELFSLQGIAAALMMFGLTGLFVISATEQEILAVISGGFASAGSLYTVRYMMQGISNLQADGTMKHEDAVLDPKVTFILESGQTKKVKSRLLLAEH